MRGALVTHSEQRKTAVELMKIIPIEFYPNRKNIDLLYDGISLSSVEITELLDKINPIVFQVFKIFGIKREDFFDEPEILTYLGLIHETFDENFSSIPKEKLKEIKEKILKIYVKNEEKLPPVQDTNVVSTDEFRAENIGPNLTPQSFFFFFFVLFSFLCQLDFRYCFPIEEYASISFVIVAY
jgi:hypothetical protein